MRNLTNTERGKMSRGRIRKAERAMCARGYVRNESLTPDFPLTVYPHEPQTA